MPHHFFWTRTILFLREIYLHLFLSNISRALLSRFWTVSNVACFYFVLQGWIGLECLTSASASCIFYKYFRFVMACCDDWWPLHSNVHLSKTIGAGVVDQVERLDGGAVVQPVASVWQRGAVDIIWWSIFLSIKPLQPLTWDVTYCWKFLCSNVQCQDEGWQGQQPCQSWCQC